MPGEVGPDDLVLLALNGGNDVAHATRTRPLHCGEQRAGTGQLQLLAGLAAAGKEFILDRQHPGTLGREVSTATQTHRMAARRPIERFGDRRPPVDDERLLVGAGDGQTPDVEGLAVGRQGSVALDLVAVADRVDTAEAERIASQVELLETVQARVDDHLPLDDGLGRATLVLDQGRFETVRHGGTHRIEAGIGPIDVVLLGLEVGMRDHLAAGVPPETVSPRVQTTPRP